MTRVDDLLLLLSAVADRLHATRPLCVLDLETTGLNPDLDRIIEITVARFNPDTRTVESLETRVNPGVPIPVEASRIHGITDADVANMPRFEKIAVRVDELLDGADVIGYNHRRFDLRFLIAELLRCGLANPFTEARTIDVELIFKLREPRTLAAAMRFFCGAKHADAHGTTADALATLQVLLAQFSRYDDLPRTVEGLDALGHDPTFIDRAGKIAWRGGKACINFGKFQGIPLERCREKGRAGDDLRGFMAWMLVKDFPKDTKDIISAALRGSYPVPPAPAEVEA